jgi:hypothetical protein
MKRIYIYIILLFVPLITAKAYNDITPGERWNDTGGTQINAHGGCVVYHEGAYYWFGEDRNVFYSNGISCYKSTDLYNWTRLSRAFTPSGSKDPNGNDAAPGRTLERPKVIYNNETGKWVMYIHWENGDDYGDAKVCVAAADKIEGPYTFYKTYRPNGHDSRDQTLFKDTDGKAYHFGSTRMNTDMLVTELTDNYLDVTENEFNALKGKQYEAPAIFKAGDLYYGLFSGCTGWDPNPGRTAYTFDLMDEWTVGENFCMDTNKETSYRSQSTYVFKVNGYEGAYIYMGDRWVSSNPGSSNVVWLPLSIRSGYPTVRWFAKWDISVFADVDRYKRAREIVTGNTYLLLERNSNRFVSQTTKDGLIIADDNETINLKFNLIETDKPYIYKIQETGSGKYFESVFGSLRLNAENDKTSQEWLFLLEEDGYYKIKNVATDDKYFAISGGGTQANSGVYLSDASKARGFSPYFDTKNFDYEPADMYSAAYRDEIKVLMDEQNEYLNSLTSIREIVPAFGTANIRIYSITGQLIPIPKENLTPGIYLVKTTSGSAITVEKIIIK